MRIDAALLALGLAGGLSALPGLTGCEGRSAPLPGSTSAAGSAPTRARDAPPTGGPAGSASASGERSGAAGSGATGDTSAGPPASGAAASGASVGPGDGGIPGASGSAPPLLPSPGERVVWSGAEAPATAPPGGSVRGAPPAHPDVGLGRQGDGVRGRGPVPVDEDAARLAALSSEAIVRVERNRGGATLTFKVRLASGARALFKPAQRHSASNHRAEIAAFHLDRALGLGRVAPVVGRRVERAALREHLVATGADAEYLARFDTEVRDVAGVVEGALIAWHPGKLVDASPPRGWEAVLSAPPAEPGDGAPSPGGSGASPSAAPARAPASATSGASSGAGATATPSGAGATATPSGAGAPIGTAPRWQDHPPEAWAAWSALVAFDFLIDNGDRWSGGNILGIQGRGLIFLDNAAGFVQLGAAAGERPWRRVAPLCRFDRGLVEALTRHGPDVAPAQRLGATLARSLGRDPLRPVLSPAHLRALDARAARLLAHVAACPEPRLL